jgi:hypothetical protein
MDARFQIEDNGSANSNVPEEAEVSTLAILLHKNNAIWAIPKGVLECPKTQ